MENATLIDFVDAGYSGHRYEIYQVDPHDFPDPDGNVRSDPLYAIVSTLLPEVVIGLAPTIEEARRGCRSTRDTQYKEYLEALSAEVELRGYTDEQVVDLIHIQRTLEKLRKGVKPEKREMRALEGQSARVPPEMVTDAMLLHAQRAWQAYLAADDENTLLWYVEDVTKG